MKRTVLSLVSLALVVAVAGFAWPTETSAPDAPSEAVTSEASDVATWNLDTAHSEVRFTVTHLAISSVTGYFRDFSADVKMDPEDPSTLDVSATAQIASVDTGNDDRDEHLRSPDFFNAEEHPEMTFESTEITNVDGKSFTMKGDLTIKGNTRPVSFDTKLLGTATGPQGNLRAAFRATTSISRKAFGLTWDKVTEAGNVIVGDEVDITLDVQTIRAES